MVDNSSPTITASLKRAYNAFFDLDNISGSVRNEGIKAMAKSLQNSFDDILEANTLDLEACREMAVPEIIVEWLKLTPERLETTVNILKRLGRISDPLQKILNAPYQLDPSQSYCQLMPLGVISLVYEAFPELGAITAALCLKTGNTLICRGCSSASYSNQAIFQALQNALVQANLPTGCIEYISPDTGISIKELVTQDQYLNLVIPYGRPQFVKEVTEQSTAPVLRTAMGNCYLYWATTGDLELARFMIMDSHNSEPDPVNAIEKVLVSEDLKAPYLIRLFNSLKENDFCLRGDRAMVAEFAEYLTPVQAIDWTTPYLNKTIAFRKVKNLEEAVNFINLYSSGHADCLVTESYAESRLFAQGIDSALVYINASPRFSRNPKRGESVFLGISNQKGYRRGLIGLEALTTLKQVVQGQKQLELY
ncbi:MAG: glutamate-5-semialdehyde dehydrogenase [Cyanobacteria bacterium J083]|nr:MAG: glutamate-5-semialdehyde dehydrogenase [Cyanobacteria bacterium J083]